jgi:hypothetical protein
LILFSQIEPIAFVDAVASVRGLIVDLPNKPGFGK